MKKMTYGDGNAIIILVAEKMGLAPSFVDDAKRQLGGSSVHPITGAAMEKEATSMNNGLRHDATLVAKANDYVQEIKAQYGFAMATVS